MAVHPYGRLCFLVDSHTRVLTDRQGWPIYDKDGQAIPMYHLVDFEPELDDTGRPDPHGEPYKCSCESFNLRKDRPCRHCVEAYEYLIEHFTPAPPKQQPQQRKRIYHLK